MEFLETLILVISELEYGIYSGFQNSSFVYYRFSELEYENYRSSPTFFGVGLFEPILPNVFLTKIAPDLLMFFLKVYFRKIAMKGWVFFYDYFWNVWLFLLTFGYAMNSWAIFMKNRR